MNHSIARLFLICALCTSICGYLPAAEYKPEVKVTPLLKTTTTVTGQPIQYPKTKHPLVTTVLVEIPPGAETGWHIHPTACFAYIMEGTITVEVKGGKTFTYHAGQAIAETVNTPHNGRNLGKKTVKIVMTVVDEENSPIAIRLDKKAAKH